MATLSKPNLRQLYLPLPEAPRPAGRFATLVHLAIAEPRARQRVHAELAGRPEVVLVEGAEGQHVEPDVRLVLIEELAPAPIDVGKSTRIVAIGEGEDGHSLALAVSRGSWGYLRRLAGGDEICAVIRLVASGQSQLLQLISRKPEAVAYLMHHVRQAAPAAAVRKPASSPLTPRELEILGFVVRGETGEVIAEKLHMGQQTVKNHMAEIFHKTGAKNRAEAAVKAVSNGWLPALE
ncbi:MAG: response regulator transcription factor [Dehalococcoidia bacterium]|nr:response regulator transcription factor [Dehalococcoidia bacterium]MSQ34292.1 response regulator transcription factor [Dehalococcoidia bacterium]